MERIEQGLAPAFLRHLVVQPRIGALLFSGSELPMEVALWLGLPDPRRPLDAIALAMFSDVGIPPPLMRLHEPASTSTIDPPCISAPASPPPSGATPRSCVSRASPRARSTRPRRVLAHSRQLAILMPIAGG
jgi:hypothetical protein